MNSADLIKELEKAGWTLRGVKGSHHVYTHPARGGHLSVPHPKKDLGAGLVKYEHILGADWTRLAAINHEVRNDWRDLRWRGVPYLPDARAVVNCDELSVTISRDGFYITAAVEKMMQALAHALRRALARRLAEGELANRTEVIVANQYILAQPLRQWLDRPGAGDPDDLLQQLAAAPIYALANRPERLSLLDIQRRRTPAWPVWYAPKGGQLNWAGGAFLRDFIVLPPVCRAGAGIPDLYPHIFDTLFGDAVTRNLCLPVDELEASYFELAAGEAGADVATGLFDGEGQLLKDLGGAEGRRTVRIGLHARHPLVEHLVRSTRPTRAYFALTYLGHELTRAQQRLVPDTPEFYFVRNSLTLDLRRGLLETLAPGEAG